MTRRRFLWLVGAALSMVGLGWVYMKYVEAAWLEVTRKRVRLGKGTANALRILHLSDFHASEDVPFELIEKAIHLGLREKPDLICLTGDFISKALPDPGRYASILSRLVEKAPTYASMGNHDGGPWVAKRGGFQSSSNMEAVLDAAGIRVLRNEALNLTVAGQKVCLVGMGDLWNRDVDTEKAFGNRKRDGATVVLSHNPDSRWRLEGEDWDLMLCGHTHGGQLIVPLFGTRPFVPIEDPAFSEGLIPWKGRLIHVTRGVGNLHGMRFNCRPEVSLLELEGNA